MVPDRRIDDSGKDAAISSVAVFDPMSMPTPIMALTPADLADEIAAPISSTSFR